MIKIVDKACVCSFHYVVLMLTLCSFTISYGTIDAQSDLSLRTEYLIKSAVIKNLALNEIYLSGKGIADSTFLLEEGTRNTSLQGPMHNLLFPGFGFTPYELVFLTDPLNIKYPNKKWKLYRVNFPNTPKNDTLNSWGNYKWYDAHVKKYTWSSGSYWSLVAYKNSLVGINDNQEIKFIAGMGLLNHAISSDFKLKKKKPRSYLPFLRMKLFSYQYDDIRFLRYEGSDMVFLLTNKKGAQKVEYEYFLNPDNPDKRGRRVRITPDSLMRQSQAESGRGRYPLPVDLPFASLQEKEDYLRDALMKNIYMYRILHLDSLEERLNIDPANGHLREGPTALDSLLPNYDEYLSEIGMYKYRCCFEKGRPWLCFDHYYRMQFPIYGSGKPGDKHRLVVGDTRHYKKVEFYRFYKYGPECLLKRESKYTEQEGGPGKKWCGVRGYYGDGKRRWYRWDFFYPQAYSKMLKPYFPARIDELGMCAFQPPPPPRPSEPPFEDVCPPTMPDTESDSFADNYLLALDTDTREVYFISGKDIYLSKAVNLYTWGKSPQEPDLNAEWELPARLFYMRDRLFRYNVRKIEEKHIVQNDDEKITVQVDGEEDGKTIKLRVTMYKARPEMLEIERL